MGKINNSINDRLKDRHRLWRHGAQGMMVAAAVGTVALIGLNPGSAILLALMTVQLGVQALAERTRSHGKSRHPIDVSNMTPVLPGDPLARRVAELAARMKMPAPDLYIMPPKSGHVSAFTSGAWSMRASRAAVIVMPATIFTATAAERPPVFTVEEQDAVLAHELTHIRNNDFTRAMLASTLNKAAIMTMMGSVITMMTLGVPLALGAIAGAGLLMHGILFGQMLASRRTELIADREALEVTRNPAALASALEKMYRIQMHYDAFRQNALDMQRTGLGHYEVITFRPEKIPTPPIPPLRISFLHAALLTHPDPVTRYEHLRRCAIDMNLSPLPETPAEPDMGDLLPRTDDGIILPPFSIAASIRRNGQDGRITVQTARQFNNAAAPSAPLPAAPPASGPRTPGPWG